MRPVEKIASCEISFLPIGDNNYIQNIEKVLEIIRSSNLEYNIGILSTTVRGDKDKIFLLIKEIYDKMEETTNFIMDIMISNTCGCK